MSAAPVPGTAPADPSFDAGDGPRVGVLALQGDVVEHLRMLAAVGARGVAVRHAAEVAAVDGLVVPGGESTTIGRLAELFGLLEPLRAAVAAGVPVLGTCAGMILLGRAVLDASGRPAPQPLIGGMDTVVRRNAFGRQVASAERDVAVAGLDGGPVRAAFIRAPWIEEAGDDVEVLARVQTPSGARVVGARQGRLLAFAFHPELTGDERLHRRFVGLVRAGA